MIEMRVQNEKMWMFEMFAQDDAEDLRSDEKSDSHMANVGVIQVSTSKRSSFVKATHYIFYLYLFIKMTQYFISQGVSGSTIPLAPLTGGQNQIIQIWHFCRTLAKRDR